MGLSVSLDIATSALRAQQLGVDVVSHNIANVNTPGFSRQELQLASEVSPLTGAQGRDSRLGQPGMGVNASEIRRIRDQFLDFQVREVLHSFGRFNAEAGALERAEVIFNEPSEGGLSNLLADFWNAWRELSNAPESTAARANVMAGSQTLVAAARQVHDQLRRLQSGLNGQVVLEVSEVNTLARQIAELNEQIVRVQVTGNNASDLQDQRDLRLDQLSRLVDTTVSERTDGAVSVVVAGQELVSGSVVNTLTTQVEPTNLGYRSVRWTADNAAAALSSGEVYGLLQARDVGVATTINDLNTLIATVITQVNSVHQAGFGLDNTTAEDFFTGADAADIGINPTLVADVNKIGAASGLNLPGDASNALAIADLQFALTMNAGTATMGDFYNAAVGRLGASIVEARSIADNQRFLRDHLETLRESVAGVSLDEEMTNLIKFQRAFEAAARLITVVDSMLETLINRVGLGGR